MAGFSKHSSGSRGAAALFVWVVGSTPALAEMCDKGSDDPLSFWALLLPVVLAGWLAVCWYFRVWQVNLGLAATLILFAGLEAKRWIETTYDSSSYYRAMVEEGCATMVGGVGFVALLILLSAISAWTARRLYHRIRPEEQQ